MDIDPDADPDGDGGHASASLSFEQYDIFVPQQRLETFDIAIMKERGPYTDDIANFMECSFHDKQMIGNINTKETKIPMQSNACTMF